MSTTNTGPGAEPAAEHPGVENRYVSAIRQAAARRFALTGYHGTSMRDIGTEMGMHAGSLYVHIRSKEDLLHAIVWEIAQSTERRMEAILAAETTPVEKLRTIAEEHLRWVADNPDAAAVYFHEWRHLKGEPLQQVKDVRERWTRALRGLIQAGIDDGTFKPMDVRLAGLAFVGVLNAPQGWSRTQDDPGTGEIAGAFMDFLLNGWLAR